MAWAWAWGMGMFPLLGYHRFMSFERITVDPQVMGGLPCIRGLRIPVATVVAMVADGMDADEVVAELPI